MQNNKDSMLGVGETLLKTCSPIYLRGTDITMQPWSKMTHCTASPGKVDFYVLLFSFFSLSLSTITPSHIHIHTVFLFFI